MIMTSYSHVTSPMTSTIDAP